MIGGFLELQISSSVGGAKWCSFMAACGISMTVAGECRSHVKISGFRSYARTSVVTPDNSERSAGTVGGFS